MKFKSVRNLILVLLSLASFNSFAEAINDIAPAQLLAEDTQDWLILDVRTAEEYAAGHVPNAINIPHDEIEDNITQLLRYQDKPVVVYCRSGRRAALAGDILLERGFNNIKHLQGDMLEWQKSELPVEQ